MLKGSSQHPPFPYDPSCLVRDPRTKGLGVPDADIVLDMASVICLQARGAYDGRVYESELLDAGFSPTEIDRYGRAARLEARERLAPRRIGEDLVPAMAAALAAAPPSGSDSVNVATLIRAGFARDMILHWLHEARALLDRRTRGVPDPQALATALAIAIVAPATSLLLGFAATVAWFA